MKTKKITLPALIVLALYVFYQFFNTIKGLSLEVYYMFIPMAIFAISVFLNMWILSTPGEKSRQSIKGVILVDFIALVVVLIDMVGRYLETNSSSIIKFFSLESMHFIENSMGIILFVHGIHLIRRLYKTK